MTFVYFLFGAAIHSVHHLDSDDEATQCWVAVAASCLSLASPTPIALDDVTIVVLGVIPIASSRPPVHRARGVVRDRAPPAPLFA